MEENGRMVNRGRVRKVVLKSWYFTGFSMILMLIILFLVGSFMLKFVPTELAISLVSLLFCMSLGVFLFAEIIISIMMKAKRADPEKYPNFVKAVEEICRKRKIWLRPRLYLLDIKEPNAMAFGWGFFGQYAIGISPSIYDLLNYEEMKGVIGHEIAHIRCRDVGISTTIGIVIGGIDTLKDMFWKGDTSLGGEVATYFCAAILWILSKVVFAFFRSAISQERELAADALSSLYTGSAKPLISALQKLEKFVAAKREESEKSKEAQEPKEASDAQDPPAKSSKPSKRSKRSQHPKKTKKSIFSDLFISHPGMEERIAMLKSLEERK